MSVFFVSMAWVNLLRSRIMFAILANVLSPVLADGTYFYWGGGGVGLIVVIVVIVLILR